MNEHLVRVDFEVDSGDYKMANFKVKTDFIGTCDTIEIPVITDEQTKNEIGERPDMLVVNIFKDVESINYVELHDYIIRIEFFSKKGDEHCAIGEVFTFPKHIVKIPEVPENRNAEGFERVNEVQIMIYKRV